MEKTRDEITADDRAIANEIFQQLGMGTFVVLTGAHKFEVVDSGLNFKLKEGEKDGINDVTIFLTHMDDYKVTFKAGDRIVSEHDGIQCDNLQDLFEDKTGLYTTFQRRS